MVVFGVAYAAPYQQCIDVLLAQRADRTAQDFFALLTRSPASDLGGSHRIFLVFKKLFALSLPGLTHIPPRASQGALSLFILRLFLVLLATCVWNRPLCDSTRVH